jgi:hypothetical protein
LGGFEPANTRIRTEVPPRIHALGFYSPLAGLSRSASSETDRRSALTAQSVTSGLAAIRSRSPRGFSAVAFSAEWRYYFAFLTPAPQCCNAPSCPPAHPCSGFYSPLAGLSRSASSETDRRSALTAQSITSGLAAIIRSRSPRGPISVGLTGTPTHRSSAGGSCEPRHTCFDARPALPAAHHGGGGRRPLTRLIRELFEPPRGVLARLGAQRRAMFPPRSPGRPHRKGYRPSTRIRIPTK